ncbi:hypothetical protein AB4254_08870 [Vibrio breoganii]
MNNIKGLREAYMKYQTAQSVHQMQYIEELMLREYADKSRSGRPTLDSCLKITATPEAIAELPNIIEAASLSVLVEDCGKFALVYFSHASVNEFREFLWSWFREYLGIELPKKSVALRLPEYAWSVWGEPDTFFKVSDTAIEECHAFDLWSQ